MQQCKPTNQSKPKSLFFFSFPNWSVSRLLPLACEMCHYFQTAHRKYMLDFELFFLNCRPWRPREFIFNQGFSFRLWQSYPCLFFLQLNIFFNFTSVVFIIHNAIAIGVVVDLMLLYIFAPYGWQTRGFKTSQNPNFPWPSDWYKLRSVKKKTVTGVEDQKYERTWLSLLNVSRLRGENIYWFTSAGFALGLQALN